MHIGITEHEKLVAALKTAEIVEHLLFQAKQDAEDLPEKVKELFHDMHAHVAWKTSFLRDEVRESAEKKLIDK